MATDSQQRDDQERAAQALLDRFGTTFRDELERVEREDAWDQVAA